MNLPLREQVVPSCFKHPTTPQALADLDNGPYKLYKSLGPQDI